MKKHRSEAQEHRENEKETSHRGTKAQRKTENLWIIPEFLRLCVFLY